MRRGSPPRRRTRRSARGTAIGPLHGIPIALKDLIEIEGRVTTGGSQVWRERRSAYTATLARRLIAAGLIVHRQDPHGRVRDGRLGHQPAPRHAVEPVGPRGRAHARRVEQRLRGGGRRRLCAVGDRHRYRRLGAVAGVVVRPHRSQDDDRPGQHLRHPAARARRSTRPGRWPARSRTRRCSTASCRARTRSTRAPAASRRTTRCRCCRRGVRGLRLGPHAAMRSATASPPRCSPPTTRRSTRWRGSAPRSSRSNCRAALPTTPTLTGRIIGAEGYFLVGASGRRYDTADRRCGAAAHRLGTRHLGPRLPRARCAERDAGQSANSRRRSTMSTRC